MSSRYTHYTQAVHVLRSADQTEIRAGRGEHGIAWARDTTTQQRILETSCDKAEQNQHLLGCCTWLDSEVLLCVVMHRGCLVWKLDSQDLDEVLIEELEMLEVLGLFQ